MARLKAGQKPEPLTKRLQRYREELVREGGRRVIVDIEKEANDALAHIMERDECTMKDAVSGALIDYARRGRGK